MAASSLKKNKAGKEATIVNGDGEGAAIDFMYKNQGRVYYWVSNIKTETLMGKNHL